MITELVLHIKDKEIKEVLKKIISSLDLIILKDLITHLKIILIENKMKDNIKEDQNLINNLMLIQIKKDKQSKNFQKNNLKIQKIKELLIFLLTLII